MIESPLSRRCVCRAAGERQGNVYATVTRTVSSEKCGAIVENVIPFDGGPSSSYRVGSSPTGSKRRELAPAASAGLLWRRHARSRLGRRALSAHHADPPKETSMKERMVYLNGSLVPESQATISVFDRGVQYGDAVYDAARTFGGRPFKLREHIDRLYRSCSYTRMPLYMTADEMEKQTREVP